MGQEKMDINYYGAKEKRDHAFEVTGIFIERYYDDDGCVNREDELSVKQFQSLQSLIDDAIESIKNCARWDEFYRDLKQEDHCDVCIDDEWITVDIGYKKGDWGTSIQVTYDVVWKE